MSGSVYELLDAETLVELILYQWNNYGTKLDCLARERTSQFSVETLDEIDRIMRQPPQHQKRVV